MLSDSNQQDRWEKRYLDGKTGWDRGGPSPALEFGLARMPCPPARVLIPACGRGYEIAELASRGYRVTGVDFAQSAVTDLQEILQAQQLKADIVASDLFAWEAEKPFDVIYEQTALCALEPQQWPEYAERLYRWLHPGGLLIGAFMQTHRAGVRLGIAPWKPLKSCFQWINGTGPNKRIARLLTRVASKSWRLP